MTHEVRGRLVRGLPLNHIPGIIEEREGVSSSKSSQKFAKVQRWRYIYLEEKERTVVVTVTLKDRPPSGERG